jgi:hypothetical protein
MKINKKTQKNLIIITLSVLFVIAIPYLLPYINQNFEIAFEDYITDGEVEVLFYEIGESSNITNKTTVTFSIFEGVNYTLETPILFYTVGNSTAISTTFPNVEGTNLINRYTASVQPDPEGDLLRVFKWHAVNTQITIIQNVTQNVSIPTYVNATVTSEQICAAVGGTYANSTCTCPNGGVKWYDNSSSSSKVCPGATVEKKVEVKILPTFFQKYGTSIIVGIILGSVIIFLLNFKGKK